MQSHLINFMYLVAEFHHAFDHPILTEPAIPQKARCDLRYNLLNEEVKEFKQALEDGDIVAVADALADIQYVLSGAILETGLQFKFPELFVEVHRSNMSKLCTTRTEAETTKHFHETPDGEACHIVERDGFYFVYRTRDMKTMKSINYSPADLEKILNK